MPKVIFSLTVDQAHGLVALAAGESIDSPRVETSLRRKGLIAMWRPGRARARLSRRGRSAAAIARELISGDEEAEQ